LSADDVSLLQQAALVLQGANPFIQHAKTPSQQDATRSHDAAATACQEEEEEEEEDPDKAIRSDRWPYEILRRPQPGSPPHDHRSRWESNIGAPRGLSRPSESFWSTEKATQKHIKFGSSPGSPSRPPHAPPTGQVVWSLAQENEEAILATASQSSLQMQSSSLRGGLVAMAEEIYPLQEEARRLHEQVQVERTGLIAASFDASCLSETLSQHQRVGERSELVLHCLSTVRHALLNHNPKAEDQEAGASARPAPRRRPSEPPTPFLGLSSVQSHPEGEMARRVAAMLDETVLDPAGSFEPRLAEARHLAALKQTREARRTEVGRLAEQARYRILWGPQHRPQHRNHLTALCPEVKRLEDELQQPHADILERAMLEHELAQGCRAALELHGRLYALEPGLEAPELAANVPSITVSGRELDEVVIL